MPKTQLKAIVALVSRNKHIDPDHVSIRLPWQWAGCTSRLPLLQSWPEFCVGTAAACGGTCAFKPTWSLYELTVFYQKLIQLIMFSSKGTGH